MKNPRWASSGTSPARKQAEPIEREMRVVYLVLRDLRVAWYCRAEAAVVALKVVLALVFTGVLIALLRML